ncbi:MAG: DsrE/DsrF/DrsH-like family protein [Anaerolineae bacterium]
MTEETVRKLAIINSKGTLDMAYPGLVLANAARMDGIEVVMFYTFWGMDIINKHKQDKLMVTPLGNPAMGMPGLVGVVPGVGHLGTAMMKRTIDELEIPPVGEFLEMVHDAGAGVYACKMSVDMLKLTEDDFVDEVDGIVTAMDFLDMAEGAQIIFV